MTTCRTVSKYEQRELGRGSRTKVPRDVKEVMADFPWQSENAMPTSSAVTVRVPVAPGLTIER